jgi:hypothetical protein
MEMADDGYILPTIERKSVKQKTRDLYLDFFGFLRHDWSGNGWRKRLGHAFDRLTRVHLSIVVTWAYFQLAHFEKEDGFGEFFSGLMLGISILVAGFGILVTLHFLYLFIFRYLFGALFWRFPLYLRGISGSGESTMVGLPPTLRCESDGEDDVVGGLDLDLPTGEREDLEPVESASRNSLEFQTKEEEDHRRKFEEAMERARNALRERESAEFAGEEELIAENGNGE